MKNEVAMIFMTDGRRDMPEDVMKHFANHQLQEFMEGEGITEYRVINESYRFRIPHYDTEWDMVVKNTGSHLNSAKFEVEYDSRGGGE